MTVVGRASPGGSVDDLTLISGRWATHPGQAVLLTDGQPSPVGIGTQVTVIGVPGSPRLTVVGLAVSITHTAQVWVVPEEIAALRAPGAPHLAQMLYRFSSAGTIAEVNADVAALRATLPHGALIGAQSWLGSDQPTPQGGDHVIPHLVLGLDAAAVLVLSSMPWAYRRLPDTGHRTRRGPGKGRRGLPLLPARGAAALSEVKAGPGGIVAAGDAQD